MEIHDSKQWGPDVWPHQEQAVFFGQGIIIASNVIKESTSKQNKKHYTRAKAGLSACGDGANSGALYSAAHMTKFSSNQRGLHFKMRPHGSHLVRGFLGIKSHA